MIKKQKQLILHGETEENGDCFRTAVACLLHLNAADVPHFCSKETIDDWDGHFVDWLNNRGLTMLHVMHGQWVTNQKGFYHLLSGPSPRFPEVDHQVIGLDGEPYFDPHPDNQMLVEDRSKWLVTVIMPLNFQNCYHYFFPKHWV